MLGTAADLYKLPTQVAPSQAAGLSLSDKAQAIAESWFEAARHAVVAYARTSIENIGLFAPAEHRSPETLALAMRIMESRGFKFERLSRVFMPRLPGTKPIEVTGCAPKTFECFPFTMSWGHHGS